MATNRDLEYLKQNPLEAIQRLDDGNTILPFQNSPEFKALTEFVNYAVSKLGQCVDSRKEECQGECGPWCTGWRNVYGDVKLDEKIDCRGKKCTECDGECFLEDDKPSDMVQQPDHYRHGKYEVIDEMLIVFGPKKTFDFCILNSWKYRARAPFKGKMEEDMEKSSRYLEMAKQIADTYEEIGYEAIRLIKED